MNCTYQQHLAMSGFLLGYTATTIMTCQLVHVIVQCPAVILRTKLLDEYAITLILANGILLKYMIN